VLLVGRRLHPLLLLLLQVVCALPHKLLWAIVPIIRGACSGPHLALVPMCYLWLLLLLLHMHPLLLLLLLRLAAGCCTPRI
jgi:hypothetical protein